MSETINPYLEAILDDLSAAQFSDKPRPEFAPYDFLEHEFLAPGVTLLSAFQGTNAESMFATNLLLKQLFIKQSFAAYFGPPNYPKALTKRCLLNLSQISAENFELACLEPEKWSHLNKAVTELKKAPFYIKEQERVHAKALTQQLEDALNAMSECATNSLGLVVFEHLSKMVASEKELQLFFQQLKQIATKQNLHFVLTETLPLPIQDQFELSALTHWEVYRDAVDLVGFIYSGNLAQPDYFGANIKVIASVPSVFDNELRFPFEGYHQYTLFEQDLNTWLGAGFQATNPDGTVIENWVFS